MSNLHSPLCFNVGFLLNQPIGTFRDIALDYAQLDAGEDAHLQDFTGSVRITRTRRGMLFSAHIRATIGAECVRCLNDFQQPLETSFDELYAFDERSITEAGLLIPEDANIDLTPLVREYILLEIPISPICHSGCKGLCPVCGEDLNIRICEHQQKNRFSEQGEETASGTDDTPFNKKINPENPLAKALKKALRSSSV